MGPPQARPAGIFLSVLRAGFYIDGFNVYGAINDIGLHHLKWMSYRELCEHLAASPWKIKALNGFAGPFEQANVEVIRLYTALPVVDAARNERHMEFVAASRAQGIEVNVGQFKTHTIRCKCGKSWPKREEKESDVRLSVDVVTDALQGLIDVAFVMTSDSDISPAVQACSRLTDVKVVSVAFQPRAHSKEIKAVAHGHVYVRREIIEKCLLDKEVRDAGGIVRAIRPSRYNPPV